jgi:hypothetical protein
VNAPLPFSRSFDIAAQVPTLLISDDFRGRSPISEIPEKKTHLRDLEEKQIASRVEREETRQRA